MRNTVFVFRRLHQMRWRLTRPARRDRREEDQAKAAFTEGLAENAVNGYACLGRLHPHPGCAGRCPYHGQCREGPLDVENAVVVENEEDER